MLSTALTPGTPACALANESVKEARQINGFGTDVDATLNWCVDVGKQTPYVGEGNTREVWELLAAAAAFDVSAARMLEPHLDALNILHQAGTVSGGDRTSVILDHVGAHASSTWGVFAAEASDLRLEARQESGRWRLRGTKPWCSLAGHLSHALVTAAIDGNRRGLFAVDLRDPGVHAHFGPWFARGMTNVVSAPVDFEDVPSTPVGEAGWYLTRPGFTWGGMSVAACWWGSAVGIAERILTAALPSHADQLALVHLGRVDLALWSARSVLAEGANLIDSGLSSCVGNRLLAERIRGAVVEAATLSLTEADNALGPAPLVTDEKHARRIADLHLYLRQHHGLRDAARLGRELVTMAGV